MARGLGIHDSCGPVYWIMVSLLGVHLVPTMLVWCVFGPVHTVWTRESPAAFKLMDILAMGTSLTGIGLQFLSDARRLLGSSQLHKCPSFEFFPTELLKLVHSFHWQGSSLVLYGAWSEG